MRERALYFYLDYIFRYTRCVWDWSIRFIRECRPLFVIIVKGWPIIQQSETGKQEKNETLVKLCNNNPHWIIT